MSGAALDQVVRAIKLRDNFLLGIQDLTQFPSDGRTVVTHVVSEERQGGERWSLMCSELHSQLAARLVRPIRFVSARDSISPETQQLALSGARNSRYALLNWRKELLEDPIVLLDLRGLEPQLLESVSLLMDGVVGVVGECTHEAARFIASSSERGVLWLGYWQVQALPSDEISSTMG